MKKNLFRMMAVVMATLSIAACREDKTDIKSKATFSFDVESLTLASELGSSAEVVVTTNSDDFTIIIPESAQSWLTYTKEGNTVTFVIQEANTSYDTPRSTTVRFQGAGLNTSGGTASLVVTQQVARYDVSFTFLPETAGLSQALGSSTEVVVTTTPESGFIVAIPEDAAAWLGYSQIDNTVTFIAITANETGEDRTADVTFTAQGSTVNESTATYTVTQTFKPLATISIDPPTGLEIANVLGATLQVTVTTNSDYFSISYSSDWLDASIENNVVTFTVTGLNTSLTDTRTAEFIFSPTGGNTDNSAVTAICQVVQAVAPPLFETTADEFWLGGAVDAIADAPIATNVEGTYSFDYGGADWFTAAFDQDAKKVTVTCTSPNDGQEFRTGTLTVTPPAGSGLSPVSVTVKQKVYTYPRKVYDRNGVKGVVFWVDPNNDQNVKVIHPQLVGCNEKGFASTNNPVGFLTVRHWYWCSSGPVGSAAASSGAVNGYERDIKFKIGDDGTADYLHTFAVPGANSDDGEVNVAAFKAFAATLQPENPGTMDPEGAFKYYFYLYGCDIKDNGTEPNKWYMPSQKELKDLFGAAWGVSYEAITPRKAITTWVTPALNETQTDTAPYFANFDRTTDEKEAFISFGKLLTGMGGSSLLYITDVGRAIQMSSNQDTGSGKEANVLSLNMVNPDDYTTTTKYTTSRPGRCIMKASYD